MNRRPHPANLAPRQRPASSLPDLFEDSGEVFAPKLEGLDAEFVPVDVAGLIPRSAISYPGDAVPRDSIHLRKFVFDKNYSILKPTPLRTVGKVFKKANIFSGIGKNL